MRKLIPDHVSSAPRVSRPGPAACRCLSRSRPGPLLSGPSCTLRGIGTALPQGWIDQADTAALAGRTGPPSGPAGEAGRRRIATLYRKVGVRRRHLVLVDPDSEGTDPDRVPFYPPGPAGPSTGPRIEQYERHAGPLAVRAAAAALADAGVDPGRVTQSVTVSCTGFAAPGVDCAWSKNLGCRDRWGARTSDSWAVTRR